MELLIPELGAWEIPSTVGGMGECFTRRDAALVRATPLWANRHAISAMYQAAKHLTRTSGIPYEVDHIYPLQGRSVSGLHVSENMRIIPRVENRVKGNK